MTHPFTDFEVAIVGGGPAGLSAALTLGRTARRTVLFDAGPPRNAPAKAAHNVFTRDGTPPLELLRIGHEQLLPYTSVEHRPAHVVDAQPHNGGYRLTDAQGDVVQASQVILATGVVDDLPDIPGVRALWGTGVFHCPYCHGHEVRGQPFVLIAQHAHATHFAQVLRGWSTDLTVCPVDDSVLSADDVTTLEALGVRIKAPVCKLEGSPDKTVAAVLLRDGERLGPAAVFTSARVHQRSPLPEQLGCTVHADGLFEGLVKVDAARCSSVPGIYVVGDAAEGFPQVISAAAEGATAAAMINNDLLLRGILPRGAPRAA